MAGLISGCCNLKMSTFICQPPPPTLVHSAVRHTHMHRNALTDIWLITALVKLHGLTECMFGWECVCNLHHSVHWKKKKKAIPHCIIILYIKQCFLMALAWNSNCKSCYVKWQLLSSWNYYKIAFIPIHLKIKDTSTMKEIIKCCLCHRYSVTKTEM